MAPGGTARAQGALETDGGKGTGPHAVACGPADAVLPQAPKLMLLRAASSASTWSAVADPTKPT
jgi:hypothetical protein